MKAVKLSKIKWNLAGFDAEAKAEAMGKLPTVKGFKAPDDFNVAEKVPGLLKKKYGYDIVDFNYTQCHIIDNVKELFLLGFEGHVKPKKFFLKSGKLSEFGEEAKRLLGELIRRRLRLQQHGTDPSQMPKVLDQLMISWETITGRNWEDYDKYEDIMGIIFEELKGMYAENLKDADERDADDEEEYEEEEREGEEEDDDVIENEGGEEEDY